ncbi:hypothetical protein [Gordonia sp. IITR100]|uniref:hypothetical protein n=1 Tax=Gordonia sp. IITR100 TaxID=1314686 RepID=UPI0011162B17|nr:hypothetical protein [Gordonia sp. IITR100]
MRPRTIDTRSAGSVRRAAAFFASVLTIGITIGADVVAGARPLHIVTLTLVVATVAALRMTCSGTHNSFFSVLNAAIAIQPVLHASLEVVPSTSGAEQASTVSGVHIALTAAVIALVTSAQTVWMQAAAVPSALWLTAALMRIPIPASADCISVRVSDVRVVPMVGRAHISTSPRRGPPAWGAMATSA